MEVPKFRHTPEPAWLLCEKISHEQHHPEYTVRFSIGEEDILAFVPAALADSIDQDRKRLRVLIIGDYGDAVVIHVPGETMPSGPRFRVPSTPKILQQV